MSLVSFDQIKDQQITNKLKRLREDEFRRQKGSMPDFSGSNDSIIDMLGLGFLASFLGRSGGSDNVLSQVTGGLVVAAGAVLAPFALGAVTAHFAFKSNPKDNLLAGVAEKKAARNTAIKGGLAGFLVTGALTALGTFAASLAWPIILGSALGAAAIGAIGGAYRANSRVKSAYENFEDSIKRESYGRYDDSRNKNVATYKQVEQAAQKFIEGDISKEQMLSVLQTKDQSDEIPGINIAASNAKGTFVAKNDNVSRLNAKRAEEALQDAVAVRG